jgi:hypothetical protein
VLRHTTDHQSSRLQSFAAAAKIVYREVNRSQLFSRTRKPKIASRLSDFRGVSQMPQCVV